MKHKNRLEEKFELIMARKYVAIPIMVIMFFGFIGGGITFFVQLTGTIDICLLDGYFLKGILPDVICDEKFLQNNILMTFAFGVITFQGLWFGIESYKGMKRGRFQI